MCFYVFSNFLNIIQYQNLWKKIWGNQVEMCFWILSSININQQKYQTSKWKYVQTSVKLCICQTTFQNIFQEKCPNICQNFRHNANARTFASSLCQNVCLAFQIRSQGLRGFGSMSTPELWFRFQSSNIVPVWFRFRSLFRFQVPSIGIKCGELGTSFSKNGWIFHAADDSENPAFFPSFPPEKWQPEFWWPVPSSDYQDPRATAAERPWRRSWRCHPWPGGWYLESPLSSIDLEQMVTFHRELRNDTKVSHCEKSHQRDVYVSCPTLNDKHCSPKWW